MLNFCQGVSLSPEEGPEYIGVFFLINVKFHYFLIFFLFCSF